jgi:putative spermidine/putrescine transport system substrate-binding protein
MEVAMKKRPILRAILTAALVLATGLSMAQDASRLTVANVGGTYNQVVQKSIVAPLQSGGKLSITTDVGTHAVRLTKLVTERGQPGTYDVVQFPDYFMHQANGYGLLENLDQARIKRWGDVVPAFRRAYAVPHIFSAAVLVYDPARIQEAPASYAVFWDPKYKGRVGALDFMYPQWLWMASTQAGNTTNHDFDKGWEKLAALKQAGLRVFPTQEALDSAIKGGQVWLTMNYRARAAQLEKAGIKVKTVVPKEGAYPVSFSFGIPKNAQNKEGAYAYLNQVLAPAAQKAAAEGIYYAPVVSDARVSEQLERTIGFTPEEVKRFIDVDFEYVAKSSPGWRQRWEEQVK